VKTPDSILGEKAAAYIVTNIIKVKKKFGMGLNKTEKKGRNYFFHECLESNYAY